MEIEYPVTCPLMGNKKIDMGTCFDIHMVVEGHTPLWAAPSEIYDTPNYAEVCEKCRYHRDD